MSSSQENQQAWLELLPLNSIKGERRVDMMSTLVKEAQATLLLKGSPRG
jgi:hypothetical protein